MKNQELFDKTISILVKAYQAGTLVHSDPCGCAVGNLVAANMRLRISISSETGRANTNGGPGANSRWYDIITCDLIRPAIHMQHACRASLEQIKATGYSAMEVAEIEFAFEHYLKNEFLDDEDGYLGLMSVVYTLMTIHEANIEEATEAKQMFVKVTA